MPFRQRNTKLIISQFAYATPKRLQNDVTTLQPQFQFSNLELSFPSRYCILCPYHGVSCNEAFFRKVNLTFYFARVYGFIDVRGTIRVFG